MRKIISFIIFLCACLVSINMSAQNKRTITGTVTDSSHETVIGASVVETGTTNGTITAIDGSFSIQISGDAKTLTFSYIGYKTQKVTIGSASKLNIIMEPDNLSLDEVVVVGYGSMKKSDLTGAVSSIKPDDIPKSATTTVAQMMKGQISGVSFTQSSSQPGAKVKMQIRGAAAGADPLIVIDGFPVSPMWEPSTQTQFGKGDKEDVLDNLNPDDIADIQVLKDASATSIYGSRAAGGVILITTKRGTNDKVDVSFKASYSVQTVAKKPDLLSPKEFMQEVNKSLLENYVYNQGYGPWGEKPLPAYNDLVAEFMAANSGQKYGGFRYDPNTIDSFQGGTDWFDAVTRTGSIQQYDLSVRGGSAKTKYSVSIGYMGNKGIAKNNDYNRTTGRLNLDQEFTSWLKGGVSVSYAMNKSNDIALSGTGDAYDVFRAARTFDPTLPIKDEDGNYSKSEVIGYAKNPVSILDVSMLTKKENMLASAYLEINPFKNLIVKATAGYNRKVSTSSSYIPTTTYEGESVNGKAAKNMDEQSDYLVNVIATYNKIFAEKHNLSVMGGWEYQRFVNDGFNAMNTGFPYDGVKWYNLWLGTNEKPTVGSYGAVSENASFLARINYSYDNRYLLTLNYRYDGSSNFAPNKQWGHFGGGAVAWRITEEPFLKDKLSWLDNLKLRFGAGVTGYAGNMTGTRTYYQAGYDYYFNNKPSSGIGLNTLGNPDLSWESQRDLNLGLDFGLFNNRLAGSIEIYERTIFNRIGYKNLMSYQEVNTLAYNTKRIDKTRGMDVAINGTIVDKKNFSWDSQLNFTIYRDMTTRRDPSEVLEINDSEQYHWNDLWYYKSDGLVRPGEILSGQTGAKAGAVRIKDLNGYKRDENGNKIYDSNGKPIYVGHPDGVIDKADLIKIANNTPIPFGWLNNFKYKNFDLSIYLYGKLNYRKDNDYKGYADPVTILNGTNGTRYIRGRMSFDNLNSDVPSFQIWSGGNGVGDYFLEKAWFIRLDDISLGYTLPKKITGKLCKSARFYFAAKNVCVITPYKGADPEFEIYNGYPSVRSYTIGVDIKF